jgi:hypothetical protein
MALQTEEDVRTKVVTAWLADHGFTPQDFVVEPVLEIRLGHHVHHPRADVLVRHVDGRNLLIVETKAPSEKLDDAARKQAISYGRLVQNGGGIPPFTVLTNGQCSTIYDTISEAKIDGDRVPVHHPHVVNGFRVSLDDLAFRAEAIQRFVSLSLVNLAAFCQAQVAFRMHLLRSEEPLDGRKYVPQLYVSRPDVEHRIDELIEQEKQIILLVGPPQCGKTNVLCRTAERYLANGHPVLFFPACAIGGLTREISDDFEWTFHQNMSSPLLVVDRLRRIAAAVGKRLIIFVDGWNEATCEAALAIDTECARLASNNITVVVSMTDVAASRLLIDRVGNPSSIARAAGIAPSAVPLIESGTHKTRHNWTLVSVGEFSPGEASAFCERAAAVFDVRIPEDFRPSSDPLLLRTAIECCRGGTLPETLDEMDVLCRRIEAKIARARLNNLDAGWLVLRELGREMLLRDAAVPIDVLAERVGVSKMQGIPDGMFDAALLMRRSGNGGVRDIDFYYSRERDFVVAYRVYDLPRILGDGSDNGRVKLDEIVRTSIGSDALRWFLTRETNLGILERLVHDFERHPSVSVRRMLMSCVRHTVWMNVDSPPWIEAAMHAGAQDRDPVVKANAAKIMAVLSEDREELAATLLFDREFLTELFDIDDSSSTEAGSAKNLIFEALSEAEHGGAPDEDWRSDTPLTSTLVELDAHPMPHIRRTAMEAFGHVAPHRFLSWCGSRLQYNASAHAGDATAYEAGVAAAINEIEGGMYGDMCPGYWNCIEDDPEECERVLGEYQELFQPLIRVYHGTNYEQSMQKLIDLLESGCASESEAKG